MLRVTTLHASSAASTASYYTQYLTDTPGEVPGVWTGRQADGLGLSGDVEFGQLEAVLEGRDPVSGTRLGYPLEDRVRANGTVVRAVAGFDATFSAPKSVSLLWALTNDPGVLEAHDVAVAATLEYLERYRSTTRVRSNGRRLHPDSQGLTIGVFRQTTSRADDPQIHTHAVISAKVHTADGRWLALDARFLKRHQRKLGGLYQSVLRNELSHHYGIDWAPIVNGQAEISGFPEELIVAFSKRAAEVDAALQAKVADFGRRQAREPTRWERAALTREAAADTRGHKTGNGVANLRAEWLAEAAWHGWSPAAVVDQIARAGRDRSVAPAAGAAVDEVIETLTTGGSTWSRADVVRAICDLQRPMPKVSGRQWAAALERACDQVLEHCVELDPADPGAARRRSDGRSMWLDPSAPHLTSSRVLTEEEHVLSWALEAQADNPSPSTDIATNGLDVLQADVAAAVAGHDRLVLAVGPAGTGKTTTLRVAVDDLDRQRRRVFGLAPTAKAARVLQRDTGMRSDTVAKLLHEWERDDRPPLDTYQLHAGTAVIVDEAGTLGTGALHRLVKLSETQHWRLVLIGDHRQLQAVGRGGLFHELCTIGRHHQLERIHRFVEPWEAAASLQLRNGDPAALDAYQTHNRIVPGTVDEHLTRIADIWLDTAAASGNAAITTSTNEHVDAINTAVQNARLQAGQLDQATIAIAGGERAHVGDLVATRRNDRRLTTTGGEPVRNRELWTVSALHPDGSLTVSPLVGYGHVTLPADYAANHVRLGYAATEHGNQSDTVTIGIELATPATTCRGLYVGMTRGRENNMLLVATDQPDVAEARDILEAILASDRADIPATTVRRQLGEDDQPPRSRWSAPARRVRCHTPDWFDDARNQALEMLAQAQRSVADESATLRDHEQRRNTAAARLAKAKREHKPYERGIAEAQAAVHLARHRQYESSRELAAAAIGRRRSARRFVQVADELFERATVRLDAVRAQARSTAHQLDKASRDARDAETTVRTSEQLAEWSGQQHRLVDAHHLVDALDGWKRWSDGHDIPPAQLHSVIRRLEAPHSPELSAQGTALAAAVRTWAARTRVDLPEPQPPADRSPDRLPGLGIEM